MLDVDFIEWRIRKSVLTAVGVMEVTRADHDRNVNDSYLAAILARYSERDIEARVARFVANSLGTNAYIVLFREGCTEFWVYNLSRGVGWHYFAPNEMEGFLKAL